MPKAHINEIEYLKGKILSIKYNEDRFQISLGGDKYIFGVTSPIGKETNISKLMQYKTLYDTLFDLDWKIKLSFHEGIKYAYSDPVQNDFSLFTINSEEEKLSYYFIENALFRTSSLWDILAQLYCLYFSVQISQDRIHYKKIFNPNSSHATNFKSAAAKISQYINQEDNTDLDGEWEGNHKFINDLRNKMTHRNSPNVATLSNYDLNLKNHPTFMLKRIIEDYVTVSNYIEEILNNIEQQFINKFK